MTLPNDFVSLVSFSYALTPTKKRIRCLCNSFLTRTLSPLLTHTHSCLSRQTHALTHTRKCFSRQKITSSSHSVILSSPRTFFHLLLRTFNFFPQGHILWTLLSPTTPMKLSNFASKIAALAVCIW